MSRDPKSTPEASPGDVTALLTEWSRGDEAALERLMPMVEDALRRKARHVMASERAGHTLEPTALVNEVYLRLVERHTMSWRDRAHFLSFAALVMRRILVDHARARARQRRGGDAVRVTLDDSLGLAAPDRGVDLLALDQALETLAELDPRQARIVELRFFAGLTLAETSEVMDLSTSVISREWKAVRAWMFVQLEGARRAT